MHIDIVPNRGSPPTVLLRESYREGKKVKKRTLANLSDLPMAQVEAIRAILRGETWGPVADRWIVTQSRAHGHAEAVGLMMKRLNVASLIAARPCRERDIVLALIASRILAPHTKLATTRWWHTTTVAETFGVTDVTENDCYAAMDWLLTRQDRIQKKLAARHLKADGLVLYDLSSSYFEGTTGHAAGNACPLAHRGYSRDGKRGTLQVNYGLMTDDRGCPVAVSVHEGNVADPATLMPEIARIKDEFGIAQFVMVGDRGMISSTAIATLRDQGGIDWITALKSASIRALVEDKTIQPDLFDERNLAEFQHPDYPGERLVACRNPQLAKLRAHKRAELLQATEEDLAKIAARVEAGRLKGQDKIGLTVGRVVNRYKMAKHFTLTIIDTSLTFARQEDAIAAEAALDGIYIIRTSVTPDRLDSASCVRHYKSLSQVERAFRHCRPNGWSMKTVDLKVRPIHHRLSDRVRAHIFLCMLAYYVEWHLKEAWRELLFADEDQEARATRDPVAPAERSAAAKAKIARRCHEDGTPVHSFQTLLTELATIVRNTCCTSSAHDAPTFTVTTQSNPLQARAMELIDTLAV